MTHIVKNAVLASLVFFVFAPEASAAATCHEMSQPLLDLSQSINDFAISALDAGIAAMSLAGTRARYGPTFKRVEHDATKGEEQFLAALRAFGELQSMKADNPNVERATNDLIAQAQEALEATAAYKGFALAYERAINHHNRSMARAAFAAAMGSMPMYATSWSVTQGYAYGGGAFSATTMTQGTISDPGASWRSASRRYELDAQSDVVSLGEMQAYLIEYKATIEMLPYKWYPITQTWVTACRAAHQLPPTTTLSDEISMAKAALSKGVSPDAVLKMFMQRTNLPEAEARADLGLPPMPSATVNSTPSPAPTPTR